MKIIINGTCNSTLDDLRIGSSEVHLVGSLTFHNLGLIIAAACSFIAILLSVYLIFMHALNYTKPHEQRHIIRILFMVPVYAAASFLSFWFYWQAIYFEVISSCYEAFAIASFFALLCHYIAPDLHEQKAYFRGIAPKPWVWPLGWLKKCCGGERGIWRTPRSGLTWFNVIWTGIYQYCFLRVTLTIVAVITQVFGKYCEASNSPLFAHIWVLVLEGGAVSVAMYCVIQFYFQLRLDLAPHSPFVKVLAIKLVIFLSFWQSFMFSILTSPTLKIVEATPKIAYPDLKVGMPSLLLCIEMAIFAVLHLWAFPYRPYTARGQPAKYSPTSISDHPPLSSELGPKQGGFLGIKALVDAMNPWDMVKGFARGMRWLVIGRKNREKDSSYKTSASGDADADNDMALRPTPSHLPIADEFRRSKFGIPTQPQPDEEGAELLAHAQPNPVSPTRSGYVPARQRYDSDGQDIVTPGGYDPRYETSPAGRQEIGMALSEPSPYQSHVAQPQHYQQDPQQYQSQPPQYSQAQYIQAQAQPQRPTPSEQWANSSRPVDRPPNPHDEMWGAGENRF